MRNPTDKSHLRTSESSKSLIQDKSSFQRVVERECRRADREGTTCTVVTFEVGKPGMGKRGLQRFQQALSRAVRSIDQIGWLDDQHLAALLPTTEEAGGRMLAERALRDMPGGANAVSLAVYTHPGSWDRREDHERPKNPSASMQGGV